MGSKLGVLSSLEVGHVLLSLLDVRPEVQEPASLAAQVSVGLISIQMPVTQSLELKHSVSQLAALKQTRLIRML